jgi:hypothetical protein
MTDYSSKLQEFHATSAQLIRAVIENVIRDTSPCHWRVIEGPEDGSQMVRVRDLMAWADKIASQLEQEVEQ